MAEGEIHQGTQDLPSNSDALVGTPGGDAPRMLKQGPSLGLPTLYFQNRGLFKLEFRL